MAETDVFESLLIQSIKHESADIGLAMLVEGIYIETMDLSGPRLILRFNDRFGILRDDTAIKELDTIKVTLADPYRSDEMNFIDDFTIMKMALDVHDILTLSCMAKVIHTIKTPAQKPQLFVKKSPQQIISMLLPGISLEADKFPAIEDYHLLPGMRVSRLLRQMAREHGALIFYRRGSLFFKSLEAFRKQPHDYEYHYNDARQMHQIVSYRHINNQPLMQDRASRCYTGWDITKGYVKGESEWSDWLDEALERTGMTNKQTLQHLTEAPITVLDLYAHGNGALKSGSVIKIIWNRSSSEAPIYECMPEKVMVGSVAHRYASQRYQCRIKAWV